MAKKKKITTRKTAAAKKTKKEPQKAKPQEQPIMPSAPQVKLGIEGLDDILKGGIAQGKSILLSGSPGTGKSIAAMQFILYGAKNNQPGLYIASEETANSIRHNAKTLGLDLENYEKENKIFIYEQVLTESEIFSLETPIKLIKENGIKRVVLDSLTLFQYLYDTDTKVVRKGIIDFLNRMKELGVTLMATIERTQTAFDEGKMTFSTEEFLFDNLVILSSIRKGASYERVLHVAKTRGQDHLMDIYPITIKRGGMVVHHKEFPFSLVESHNFKR